MFQRRTIDVLVALDDQDLRRSVNSQLWLGGYKVRLAGSSAGASALIHDAVPDVMIVDVKMREMDVFKFVGGIRGGRTIPYFPVIFLTGSMDIASRARELGGVCVRKPVQAGKLLATVASSSLIRHPRPQFAQPAPSLMAASNEYFRLVSRAQVP
jgi:CheY-like chemotaxis protein